MWYIFVVTYFFICIFILSYLSSVFSLLCHGFYLIYIMNTSDFFKEHIGKTEHPVTSTTKIYPKHTSCGQLSSNIQSLNGPRTFPRNSEHTPKEKQNCLFIFSKQLEMLRIIFHPPALANLA